MVLTEAGRRRLSELARARPRYPSGRFLPLGRKYVYDMAYINPRATRQTPKHLKWWHVRITQYFKKIIGLSWFQRIADRHKPANFAIPTGRREKFESLMDLKYSKRQARLEGIVDQKPYIEDYQGSGGALRNT